ncbi:MAG TPA: DUF535 family protein [Burkholderiaceae bacterium]|nr:DUF535 family protein [Burkholderiaceae bacterium]
MSMTLKTALAHPGLCRKDRLKLRLGALLHPGATRRWLQYIHGEPLLAQACCPRLLTKAFRPYLRNSLRCPERVDTLINHYDTLGALGLLPLASAAAQQPQVLHGGLSKSGLPFCVELNAIHDGHREGELCLRLRLDGVSLFGLSFVLQQRAGQLHMLVGRLQGESGDAAREHVRLATKEFHACRPATLLVTAARQLAQVLGCESVRLVCNRERIAINLWRRWRIRADYDQSWQELGARRGDDGLFELAPVALQELDYEQIPSKKRSEARKRAALLDEIHQGLSARLACRQASFTSPQ